MEREEWQMCYLLLQAKAHVRSRVANVCLIVPFVAPPLYKARIRLVCATAKVFPASRGLHSLRPLLASLP